MELSMTTLLSSMPPAIDHGHLGLGLDAYRLRSEEVFHERLVPKIKTALPVGSEWALWQGFTSLPRDAPGLMLRASLVF